MIGETQVPFNDEEGDEGTNTCALLLKDQEFILSTFGQDKTKQIEGTLCDWINDVPISSIWHQGAHYQSYLSKIDVRHCDQRSFPKNLLIHNELCP